MSDFTGLNAEVAKKNIDDFKNTSWEVMTVIWGEYRDLFFELSQTWASKNAVSFGKKYTERYNEYALKFENKVHAITENAISAYNVMARANGADRISEPESIQGSTVHQSTHATGFVSAEAFEEVNAKGVTGMNVRMIRDFIIPAYESKIMSAVAKIDTIPTSIALYDDENGQQVAFSHNINEMKTEIETITTELFAELKGYLETEIDTMLLAKEKSTDILSGNA